MNRATLCAEINTYTGYGQHALQIIRALKEHGQYVAVRPLKISEAFGAAIPGGVKSLFVNSPQPEPWEILLRHPRGFLPTPGKHTAWFTMWETTQLPKETVAALNRSRVIMVPSAWNESCFSASGVRAPIRIVPLGINPDIYRPRGTPVMPDGVRVVFGAGGRLMNGPKRKGVNEVVAAFQKAFPKERDVRLRVKVFPDCPLTAVADPRVEVTAAYLGEAEMAAWYLSLTCYVSGARGEAWGLMQQQAMACGRVVIGSIFGGLSEFMTPANSYAVPYKLVAADAKPFDTGYWAEPDEAALIETMRDVYRHPERAVELGRAAAPSVRHLTWRNHDARLLEVLAEFGIIERHAPKFFTRPFTEVSAGADLNPGIAVIMSTHNRSDRIDGALDSLNQSLAGRRWALFVADDSSDDTLARVRGKLLNAELRLATGFAPTEAIGEGKNRACRMALPFIRRYPWVTYQDDDDVCLPGKFDFLLPYALEHGHEFIVGDAEALHADGSTTVFSATQVFNPKTGGYCPGAVLHRSGLLGDGRVFDERLFTDDDLYAFLRFEQRGVPMASRGGRLVYQHVATPKSRGCVDMRFAGQVLPFGHWEKFNGPASFCTVAVGLEAAKEASIMLQTLRFFHPTHPVFVVCDEIGLEHLRCHEGPKTFLLPMASRNRMHMLETTICKGNKFRPARANAVWTFKMDAITAAVDKCGDTVFLDSDIIVTGRISKPYPECDFGLTPHWVLSSRLPDQLDYFGSYNSGMVYCANAQAAAWWRNTFLEAMGGDWWGKAPDKNAPHGMFSDQTSLDLLPGSPWRCAFYHPGYNVGRWRFVEGEFSSCPQTEVEDFLARQGFQVGGGVFMNGYPVTCFHHHLFTDTRENDVPVFVPALLSMLRASTLPEHAQVGNLLSSIIQP